MTKQNLKQKHVPMRMCLVTREKLPKSELIRIVKLDNGSIVIDLSGRVPGRGANIKADKAIFLKVFEKNTLQRALKMNKSFTPEEKKKLTDNFNNAVDEKNFRNSNKPVRIRVKRDQLEGIKEAEKV